jgi:hypothetical protein
MCVQGLSRGSMKLYMDSCQIKMGKRSLKILMQNVKTRRRMITKRHRSLMQGQNGKIIMSNMRSQTIKILKKKMMKTKILKLTRMPKSS